MNDFKFLIGGRYRNRRGYYSVLEINKDTILVEYEDDGSKTNLDIDIQFQIITNMELEDLRVCPFNNDKNNNRYFVTVGFISQVGFIEAIIPPKSKEGFDSEYYRIKQRYPISGQDGYYVHQHSTVDKWGIEMRLTIPREIPNEIMPLTFDQAYHIVDSPDNAKQRINSNKLCWRLLELGFDLGDKHPVNFIEQNVPDKFRKFFNYGKNIFSI